MTIKLEAFITLEEALTSRLQTSFAKLATPLLQSVGQAVADKQWDRAAELIQTLDLRQVVDDNEPHIKYVSQLAVMFGASRVTRRPGTSRVGLGFESAVVGEVVQAFKRAVSVSMRDQMVKMALQLIAIEREKDSPTATGGTYLGRVLKAAKAPGLLPFESFVDKQGKSMFNMASSLHTSRLAAFGFTAEADYLGVQYYQITERLDPRTCPVCQLMHGKEFKVSDARSLLDIVIRTQDPDELKTLQPWPKQSKAALEAMGKMEPQQLVSNGWHVPPFHPRCRGLLEASGRVPADPGDEPPPQPLAEPEDFKQFGLKLPPSKVKTWNSIMQTQPSAVLSKLLGMSQEDLLTLALTGVGPKGIGLANFSVTSTSVKIELQKSIYGSDLPIAQHLLFKKSGALSIGLVDLGNASEKHFKSVMKGIYQAATVADMKTIQVAVDASAGSSAWAKYGFAPTLTSWKRLLKQIKSSPFRMGLITKAKPAEAKAAMLILNSNDPRDIFALADLPTLGRKLLSDLPWDGIFDLEDPESVIRFISTVGAKA